MLTANYEYSRINRQKSRLPIQMQLSKKTKPFVNFLFYFWNQFLEHFEKNESYSLRISEIIDSERRAYLNA